jgi:hypothetical protein
MSPLWARAAANYRGKVESVKLHTPITLELVKFPDLLRQNATQRQRRQCVNVKETGGVRFNAGNLAQSANLSEEHKFPDVKDRWGVPVFWHVPKCEESLDGYGVPAFLANFTYSVLSRRGTDVSPSPREGPATIGRFAHEQNFTSAGEYRASDVELRIGVAFFASKKLRNLLCLHVSEFG